MKSPTFNGGRLREAEISMSDAFIPFGAQYYRAPTPLKGEWDKDLTAFRERGFNTIKIWAQWRWNNPGENRFYFDDLDELMDTALKHDVKVVINTIFDVAPAWFFKKYPDSVMITCDSRKLGPQTTAWRQIGGAPGPCYNHEEGIRLRKEFLKETVNRYKNHPALYLWDLWNEPEMTCGILREPVQEDMVCYCDNCVGKFREWLERKYGTIDGLNRSWNRNYADWSEVEAPKVGDTFNDMIDWRSFFSFTLTEELRRRVEVVKSCDRKNPVMVHTVPMPYFNAINSCNNDYELAKLCDLFGNSAGSNPFPIAFNSTCADGKRVLNAEIHAFGGDTYIRPKLLSYDEVKSHIYVPLARGAKGFLYWQYRPETLGWEGPAWGLTSLDGGETSQLDYNTRICAVLQKNARLIENVNPVPSQIAVVNSYKNQVFDWCVPVHKENDRKYVNSVIGTFMALYDGNLNVDVLGLEQFSAERLKKYKVIYCPFPYYMDADTTSLLRQWVSEGGCLVSEAFFGAVKEEDGLHSTVIPGYGFTDVFGVKEGISVTASTFKNAYGKSWGEGMDEKYIRIIMSDEVGKFKRGGNVFSYFLMEELIPSDARVLGSFENGMPAVTVNNFGKGKAIMIGGLLGCAYAKKSSKDLSDFITSLAEMGGISRSVTVEGGKVRVDLLKSDETKEALLIVNSSDDKEAMLKVSIDGVVWTKSKLVNPSTGEEIPVTGTPTGFRFDMKVMPNGRELYIVK